MLAVDPKRRATAAGIQNELQQLSRTALSTADNSEDSSSLFEDGKNRQKESFERILRARGAQLLFKKHPKVPIVMTNHTKEKEQHQITIGYSVLDQDTLVHMLKLGYSEVDIQSKFQDSTEMIGKLYQRLLLLQPIVPSSIS